MELKDVIDPQILSQKIGIIGTDPPSFITISRNPVLQGILPNLSMYESPLPLPCEVGLHQSSYADACNIKWAVGPLDMQIAVYLL